jgi:hypothetical protein
MSLLTVKDDRSWRAQAVLERQTRHMTRQLKPVTAEQAAALLNSLA